MIVSAVVLAVCLSQFGVFAEGPEFCIGKDRRCRDPTTRPPNPVGNSPHGTYIGKVQLGAGSNYLDCLQECRDDAECEMSSFNTTQKYDGYWHCYKYKNVPHAICDDSDYKVGVWSIYKVKEGEDCPNDHGPYFDYQIFEDADCAGHGGFVADGGHDIGRWIDDLTLDECKAACNAEPTCKSFQYRTGTNQGDTNVQCQLKNKRCSAEEMTLIRSGNLYVKLTPDVDFDEHTYTAHPNKDLAGNDLTNVVGTTVDHCKFRCSQYASCAGFAFITSSNRCWIKGGGPVNVGDLVQKYPHQNVVFYIRN